MLDAFYGFRKNLLFVVAGYDYREKHRKVSGKWSGEGKGQKSLNLQRGAGTADGSRERLILPEVIKCRQPKPDFRHSAASLPQDCRKFIARRPSVRQDLGTALLKSEAVRA